MRTSEWEARRVRGVAIWDNMDTVAQIGALSRNAGSDCEWDRLSDFAESLAATMKGKVKVAEWMNACDANDALRKWLHGLAADTVIEAYANGVEGVLDDE